MENLLRGRELYTFSRLIEEWRSYKFDEFHGIHSFKGFHLTQDNSAIKCYYLKNCIRLSVDYELSQAAVIEISRGY